MRNEIRNQGDTAQVYLYDIIGADWYGGITANEFVKELDSLKAKQVDVRINSPGGDVFDGMAIYNSLGRSEANVTVHIDGLAASIAAVIAMAGDEIRIAENAHVMIHNAWTLAIGDADELRQQAQTLDTINDSIVDTFTKRTGQEREAVAAAMSKETWFDAEEAVAFGLASEVAQPMKVAAAIYDPKAIRAALVAKPRPAASQGPQTPYFEHMLEKLATKHGNRYK